MLSSDLWILSSDQSLMSPLLFNRYLLGICYVLGTGIININETARALQ